MKSATNQKLTDSQIKDIKLLHKRGVRVSFLAKVLQAEGLALSTTYYHLSKPKVMSDQVFYQKQHIKKRMAEMIDQGLNTGQIARDWNIELGTLNKIYTT